MKHLLELKSSVVHVCFEFCSTGQNPNHPLSSTKRTDLREKVSLLNSLGALCVCVCVVVVVEVGEGVLNDSTYTFCCTDVYLCGLYPAVGVHVPPGGMAQRLLEEQLKKAHDRVYQSQKAASELELERRNILHAMRYREPERGGF